MVFVTTRLPITDAFASPAGMGPNATSTKTNAAPILANMAPLALKESMHTLANAYLVMRETIARLILTSVNLGLVKMGEPALTVLTTSFANVYRDTLAKSATVRSMSACLLRVSTEELAKTKSTPSSAFVPREGRASSVKAI